MSNDLSRIWLGARLPEFALRAVGHGHGMASEAVGWAMGWDGMG